MTSRNGSVAFVCTRKQNSDLIKSNRRVLYCPLDLYGGCTCRVRTALIGLFETPQNNLALAVNGDTVSVKSFDENNYMPGISKLLDILVKIFLDDSIKGDYTANVFFSAEYCRDRKTRHREDCLPMGNKGIFKLLKSLQKFDLLDIEWIHNAYLDLSRNKYAFENISDFRSPVWKKSLAGD